MCDQDHFEEDRKEAEARGLVTRRQFGALVGVGVAMMLPKVVNAVAVTEQDVTIKTPDGNCDAYFVHVASGTAPAVLVWPDIFGLRTSFRQMGKRLAESGYSVLVVNPFYRTQKAPTAPDRANFQDPDTRTKLFALAGTLSPQTNVTDAKAFVAWLDKQPAGDKKKKMGTTGYCMGGPITMRTAAEFPGRVGAGGSFHGGGRGTDKPDSPHLLVPKMKAHYLFAIAQNDDEKQPEAKTVLKETFAKAKLPAEIEVY